LDREAGVITNFFKKSLIKNANLFRKGLTANLLRKGLIENPGSGVINRRNGCGATVAFEPKY
jgi:hypothetical protein